MEVSFGREGSTGALGDGDVPSLGRRSRHTDVRISEDSGNVNLVFVFFIVCAFYSE